MLWPLLIALGLAQAACPDPDQAVDALVGALEAEDLDRAAFASKEAEAAVGCSFAAPDTLARLWLAQGALDARRGALTAANDAFAAAQRLNPSLWLADAMVGLRRQVEVAVASAEQGSGSLQLQPLPQGWAVSVNGRVGVPLDAVPAGLTLVQVGPEAGEARFARFVYLVPGQQLVLQTGLQDPPLVEAAPALAEAPPAPERSRRRPPILLIAGAASGTLAIGSAALALSQNEVMQYSGDTGDLDGVNAAHRRQVAFGTSAYTLAGLAATAVVLHFTF